jgi:hypothetical protein
MDSCIIWAATSTPPHNRLCCQTLLCSPFLLPVGHYHANRDTIEYMDFSDTMVRDPTIACSRETAAAAQQAKRLTAVAP